MQGRLSDLPTNAAARHEGSTRSGRPKLYSLQILRFVAAFAVVLFHLGAGYQADLVMERNIFGIGAWGVDIFFVISGFIIAFTTDPGRGLLYFAWRRVVRIVPLYWSLTLGLAAIGLIMPELLDSTVIDAESLLKSLFFIPYERGDGSVRPILFLGWTLNYEMFFYALYGLGMALGFRTCLMPLALVVAVVAAGYLLPIESVVWNFYTNPILLEFACGIVLCVVYRRYTDAFARASPFLVALLILVLAVKLAFPGVQSLWAGAIPAVIVVAAALSIRVAKTPFSSFLILLGDASYSLYLSHPYVLQLWVKVSPENLSMPVQVIMGFIVCLAAVVVSVALYRLLELPSQRILLGRGRQRLAPTLIAGR